MLMCNRVVRDLVQLALEHETRQRNVGRYSCCHPAKVEFNGRGPYLSAFVLNVSLSDITLLHWVPVPLGRTEVLVKVTEMSTVVCNIKIKSCQVLEGGWYLASGPFISANAITDECDGVDLWLGAFRPRTIPGH
jgi:hypothetical protein